MKERGIRVRMVLFLNYLSDPLAAIRLLSLISEHRSKMAEDTDVRALLESYAAKSELQTTFDGCITNALIPELKPPDDLASSLRSVFSSSSNNEVRMVQLQQFVMYVYSQNNHQRVKKLLSLLSSFAATGLVPCRAVCEQLISHLDSNKLLFWSEALATVREIVGGVDYKGCRDLMKLLFDRFHRIPRSLKTSHLSSLATGRDLLAYILDRNAALLPAYFAYDEICRHYPDKTRPPHWLLQEAIAPLHKSMKTLADLVSGVVLPYLRPVLSVSNMSLTTWKLEPEKYGCSMEGLLPYREVFTSPQTEVLYHVIAQPNSRDAVHSMLGMNRQQMQPCAMVEEALVRLALVAMEMVENAERGDEGEERVREVWSQLANKLVFFYFLQLINVTSVINLLREKVYKIKLTLSCSHLRKGRSWLMWSLLHFVTSTVQSKLPVQQQTSASSTAVQLQKEFIPILNLFSLLYQDRDPLPPPDPTQLEAVLDTAMASIWVVYSSRAATDGVQLPRPVPHILTAQIKWLSEQSEALPVSSNLSTDHTIALLLSVYSNNSDVSSKLLNILIEAVAPSSPSSSPELSTLPLCSLSTIAMHAKIRLMDKVKHHLVQVAEASKQIPSAQQPPTITPALLETYSRLLIWLGTRNFQTHLIPAVFKSQAWPVLHALLEVIAHRVHLQLQYSYRFQLLQQLHTVVGVSIIPAQLFVCAENTTLRLIQGLSSPEFLLQLAKQYASDPKPLLSQESEELNRVFVCVLAQSMHISNLDTTNWLESFMRAVFTAAPQTWPEATSRFFPGSLRQLCTPLQTSDYQVGLVAKAEEEYRKFKGKSNERDLIQLYTESEAALFLCVVWQQLLESGTLQQVCVKIIQRTQAKKLAASARKMVDYIVFICPPPSDSAQFNSVVGRLNELVWKYHIFPLDRLLLCMVMRGYDGQYATVALSLIHHMLLTDTDLHTRLSVLIDTVRPDHWNCPNWHATHAEFLQKYPETFQPEIPGSPSSSASSSANSSMTMYFGNVCLRFLPVLCLYLHRLLEAPELATQYLDQTLDKFGCLFIFHAHPVNYLYTTLHYYEKNLQDRPELKRKLVATIMGAQNRVHPLKWYFTSPFCEFLCSVDPVYTWSPSLTYYQSLLHKLVEGLKPFSLSAPSCDWQCSEFSGSVPFSLMSTCVELLCLPLSGKEVCNHLLQALYKMAAETESEEDTLVLINAMTLIFISLPVECYQQVLYDAVLQIMEELEINMVSTSLKSPSSCLLSLMHSFWLHGNMGILLTLPQWLQLQVGGVVSHEGQLLYVMQLLGPIMHRIMAEKPKLLLEIVMEVYRLLKVVDQRQKGLLQHSDTICDFLYHIKYRHIGDAHGKKEELEQLVTSLHQPLRTRLRFLTHSLAEHTD